MTAQEISNDGAKLVRRVVLVCVACEVLLLLLDLSLSFSRLLPWRRLRHLFNIAREDGLATFFASTQALLVAVAVALIAWLLRRDGARPRRVLAWLALASSFAYLAVDDALGIHERVGSAAQGALGDNPNALAAYPSYFWQMVYAPIFGAMALLLVWLPWTPLRRSGGLALLLGGLACFVVAVGLDFLEGLDTAHAAIAASVGASQRTVGHLLRALEEELEMLGTTALLWAFGGHAASLARGRSIVVQ